MESINCIFCDIESTNILIKENGYLGKKCPKCSLIYISPRPNFEDIIDLYGHDNAHATADSHIKFSYGKKLYSNHTLKIINRYVKGKMLEIGAGAGYFLNEARNQGFKPHGIEFNEMQADFINKYHKIPCELKALSEKTFYETTFDVIYHCDVISHFYNPIEEFNKIHDKLSENGYVIFETGNFGDVKTKYFKYFTKFQYPDHLFFFSEQNIKTLLEKTNFELLKIYRYSILEQLLSIKALRKINSFIKPNKDLNHLKGYKLKLSLFYSKKFHFIRHKLKNFYTFLFYNLRYKIGYIVPKKGKPQTMIIVAKKKSC